MICKICAHESQYKFSKLVLNKYHVKYFECSKCLFVQTEEPHWLNEAYTNAITSLDIGMIYRNIYLTPIVQAIINSFLKSNGKFLDFGGGYGMFVRLMRDRGFDFYRQDKFCDNLFAKSFDIEDIHLKSGFEAITTFELFEHLPDPIEEIKQMLTYSENIIFSTDLIPKNIPVESWEYLVPEVGQHVAMYHQKSLMEIADQLKLNVYSNGVNIHMFTPQKINPWFFKQVSRPRVSKLLNLFVAKPTLLATDYKYLKKKISESGKLK